jgi:hypothetical protein
LIFRVEMMEAHLELKVLTVIRHTESFIRLSIPESFLLSVMFFFHFSQTQHKLNLFSTRNQPTKHKKFKKFKLNLFIYFQNHQIFQFASLSFLSKFFFFTLFSLFFLLTISIPIFNFRVFNFFSITALLSVLYSCY